ncbi:peptidase M14 [Bordetella genomosp. 13]|uniref:peptidase M14 n=1 Tax=Bordetella genomosp. 13 TaxID=463040 RepID=UPI0021B53588|nr:peptidase M14 [Bordetella genomosp. 13]
MREFSAPAWRGARVEGWLFEGPQARRAAEAALADAGVAARLHSAYKPLLHHVLEAVDAEGLLRIAVRHPVHPRAAANRYTLEAYPLAGLLPGVAVTFEPGGAELLDPLPRYAVTLEYADGRVQEHDVTAPNALQDTVDGPTLSPTGWLRVYDIDGQCVRDAAWRTEYQAVYDAALACVRGQAWHRGEPYFERLELRVDIPAVEYALARDEDLLSTCEALHEDLYFSLLEHFQRLSGRPPGDRGLQPGQIVPDVRPCDGPARLRIAAVPFPAVVPVTPQAPDGDLASADAPLAPGLIAGHLAALGGAPFRATSRQGRPVLGAYFAGAGPAVLISAGQHANETSGVIGALRAAQALREAGHAHFALIPAENPDGYALHQELCAVHPRHMHHAARYSALGDDVAYRERAPRYEQQARIDALAISGAQLHVNLHGYPAHEWTRPLSGYLPRHFERWTLPQGFFLVMRYHAGRRRQAERLIDGVTARLARLPGLLDFNARQTALLDAHAGSGARDSFETINGMAVVIAESQQELAPLALLTEFPDETVYGERFRYAHSVQQAAVLAAVEAYREGWEHGNFATN